MQATERTSITRHLEIEALQEVLRWPDNQPGVAVTPGRPAPGRPP